jgi:hypothetical protein
VGGAGADHSEDGGEHAADGGDFVAVAIARGGEGVVVAEELIGAVDEMDGHD